MIDSGNEDITPEWIEWALKKADWYDPSIATEDEYLGKRQHEKVLKKRKIFTRQYQKELVLVKMNALWKCIRTSCNPRL